MDIEKASRGELADWLKEHGAYRGLSKAKIGELRDRARATQAAVAAEAAYDDAIAVMQDPRNSIETCLDAMSVMARAASVSAAATRELSFLVTDDYHIIEVPYHPWRPSAQRYLNTRGQGYGHLRP